MSSSLGRWFNSGSGDRGLLAQLVEHVAVNRKVDGSIPSRTAFFSRIVFIEKNVDDDIEPYHVTWKYVLAF